MLSQYLVIENGVQCVRPAEKKGSLWPSLKWTLINILSKSRLRDMHIGPSEIPSAISQTIYPVPKDLANLY